MYGATAGGGNMDDVKFFFLPARPCSSLLWGCRAAAGPGGGGVEEEPAWQGGLLTFGSIVASRAEMRRIPSIQAKAEINVFTVQLQLLQTRSKETNTKTQNVYLPPLHPPAHLPSRLALPLLPYVYRCPTLRIRLRIRFSPPPSLRYPPRQLSQIRRPAKQVHERGRIDVVLVNVVVTPRAPDRAGCRGRGRAGCRAGCSAEREVGSPLTDGGEGGSCREG